MISFFNKSKGGSGGDGTSQNIFCQLDEPTIKKGIWLQAEREIEHITTDEEIFIAGTWADDGIYPSVPYPFQQGGGAQIGTDIYLFGSTVSGYYKTAKKYNTLTKSYSNLTSVPADFSRSICVEAVGTNIYLFGGYNIKTAYKYDTLTDTYTQITNVPTPAPVFYNGASAVVGTDIYLFGNDYNVTSDYQKYAYKYDTLTDTYTRLANIPTSFNWGVAKAVGNYIYLFNYKYNTTTVYKYNISNNSYSSAGTVPNYMSIMNTAAAVVGTDIYLFGGNPGNSPTTKACKYSTISNTFTELTDLPYAIGGSNAENVGDKIYVLGGSSSTSGYNKLQVLNLTNKTYSANTVVIAQGKYKKVGYEIELYSNEKNQVAPIYPFADAWFYSNQLETNIPTYYGDGTNWNKIKN